ncbi:nucleoside-diphosphate sugar epimerase/dehydratase [Pelagicoccus mobilis]|uniref:Uncharacterized protein n=1 Tax=Pelagicoccus mobilis TaxID=415221 RepID=A0A934RXP2_9BACT|nr:hypothetical protein [Pelagicoccus mobilis]MBK1878233.1 hypothetical protein [Pelagicoccus mobilis]
MSSKPRTLLFGASIGGKNVFKKMRRSHDIVAFIDNDRNKQGTSFLGKPIISPNDIRKEKYDKIMIASSYHEEIFEQLVDLDADLTKIEIAEPNLLIPTTVTLQSGCVTWLLILLPVTALAYWLITN